MFYLVNSLTKLTESDKLAKGIQALNVSLFASQGNLPGCKGKKKHPMASSKQVKISDVANDMQQVFVSQSVPMYFLLMPQMFLTKSRARPHPRGAALICRDETWRRKIVLCDEVPESRDTNLTPVTSRRSTTVLSQSE